MIGVFAALVASFLWAGSSSIWSAKGKSFIPFDLNLIKTLVATLFFCPLVISIPWVNQFWPVAILMLSGVVGIALGDTLYLAALQRLGSRRTLTIEALSPLIAGLSGTLLMGEAILPKAWIGVFFVSCSVFLVGYQYPPVQELKGSQSFLSINTGFLLAFASVLSGVFGAGLSRLVLINGQLMPIQTAEIRLIGALIALLLFFRRRIVFVIDNRQSFRSEFPYFIFATFLGTNLGIFLQQIVFQQLPIGLGTTLLSTSPVMALLFLRYEGEKISTFAIFTSLISLVGIGLALG